MVTAVFDQNGHDGVMCPLLVELRALLAVLVEHGGHHGKGIDVAISGRVEFETVQIEVCRDGRSAPASPVLKKS